MEKKKSTKKEVKKPVRQPVTATEENLKIVRKIAVVDFPLAEIRKALGCTWGEAVELRHEALKRLQWFNAARNQ